MDLGFLRGHQGHQRHDDDDEDEDQDDKVEDNNKDDDNNNNNDKVISALELDRDMVFVRTSRKSRTLAS